MYRQLPGCWCCELATGSVDVCGILVMFLVDLFNLQLPIAVIVYLLPRIVCPHRSPHWSNRTSSMCGDMLAGIPYIHPGPSFHAFMLLRTDVVMSASPSFHSRYYVQCGGVSIPFHSRYYVQCGGVSIPFHSRYYVQCGGVSIKHARAMVMVHCYCTVIETANMKLKKDFLAASLCRQIYYLPAVVTIATWHVEGGSCINSPLELANCS